MRTARAITPFYAALKRFYIVWVCAMLLVFANQLAKAVARSDELFEVWQVALLGDGYGRNVGFFGSIGYEFLVALLLPPILFIALRWVLAPIGGQTPQLRASEQYHSGDKP